MAQKERLGRKNSEGKELLVEIAYGLRGSKRDTIKVFKDDDPHELAVRFCEKHCRPNSSINLYEQNIIKFLQNLSKDGIT